MTEKRTKTLTVIVASYQKSVFPETHGSTGEIDKERLNWQSNA
jgi:hypothetical protein|tara:strand:+ start:596 stop:724 length:129 start_codon:yes stop_codon:yes gene_type:complete